MTYGKRARITRGTQSRGNRATGFLVVTAAVIASVVPHLPASSSSTAASPRGLLRSHQGHPLVNAVRRNVWPPDGQAAVQMGQSQIQAGPNQHAAPIASVAKAMTAYLV